MNKEGLGAISFDTAFMRSWQAEADDIDILNHVNNTVYVRWVQEIAVQHWHHIISDELREKYIFIVLRHEIEYRDPILLEDDVEIRTWLGKAHGPRFERYVDIRKKNSTRTSAKALTSWCMLDLKTRRPTRIGNAIFDAFGLTPEQVR